MTDFSALFEQLLNAAEEDMRKDFTTRRDTLVEGRWIALDASFDLEGERKPFGLIPTGVKTHCHERCLFIPMQELTGEGLEEALDYITRVHDNLVEADQLHEFSLFSLVLVTDHFDHSLHKRVKKYAHDVRHQAPARGWSSVRVAVVDLSAGTILTNKLGDTLGDRLRPTVKRLG
ncbi:MAG: hypothetical protein AB7C89_00105 [Intestinibacillus sp.]